MQEENQAPPGFEDEEFDEDDEEFEEFLRQAGMHREPQEPVNEQNPDNVFEQDAPDHEGHIAAAERLLTPMRGFVGLDGLFADSTFYNDVGFNFQRQANGVVRIQFDPDNPRFLSYPYFGMHGDATMYDIPAKPDDNFQNDLFGQFLQQFEQNPYVRTVPIGDARLEPYDLNSEFYTRRILANPLTIYAELFSMIYSLVTQEYLPADEIAPLMVRLPQSSLRYLMQISVQSMRAGQSTRGMIANMLQNAEIARRVASVFKEMMTILGRETPPLPVLMNHVRDIGINDNSMAYFVHPARDSVFPPPGHDDYLYPVYEEYQDAAQGAAGLYIDEIRNLYQQHPELREHLDLPFPD